MTELPGWLLSDYKLIQGDIDDEVAKAYAESLRDHVRFVIEAGRMIGVSESRLMVHDHSKFTPDEFPAYAKHFHGGGAPNEFAHAWMHHIHHNSHHWQHWIFPDGYTPKDSNVENGVLRMPVPDAREMIADWMGASMAYTGSWDMTDWLWKNMPRIRVHSATAVHLREALDAQGYADIVYGTPFAHEEQK